MAAARTSASIWLQRRSGAGYSAWRARRRNRPGARSRQPIAEPNEGDRRVPVPFWGDAAPGQRNRAKGRLATQRSATWGVSKTERVPGSGLDPKGSRHHHPPKPHWRRVRDQGRPPKARAKAAVTRGSGLDREGCGWAGPLSGKGSLSAHQEPAISPSDRSRRLIHTSLDQGVHGSPQMQRLGRLYGVTSDQWLAPYC